MTTAITEDTYCTTVLRQAVAHLHELGERKDGQFIHVSERFARKLAKECSLLGAWLGGIGDADEILGLMLGGNYEFQGMPIFRNELMPGVQFVIRDRG